MSNHFLAHARNVHISGGIFHQTTYGIDSGFEQLAKAAVLSATHDSGESFDRPKCHENTRVAVLKRLMSWALREIDSRDWMLWLYGDAGAGKSAIGQTLAERCVREGILLGSFFFSRNDSRRKAAAPLVATLAYQACTVLPELKDIVSAVVSQDPQIFEKTLETQLLSLLVQPLNMIARPAEVPIPYLIIIDGLDECTDVIAQSNILTTLVNAVDKCDIPLKIFVASRPEPEIRAAFSSDLFRPATRLALNSSYRPDVDIRRFLEKTFEVIRTTHPLRNSIPASCYWPSYLNLDDLVKRSSGQFIYAATIAKYIECPREEPDRRLRTVLGLIPLAEDDDLPFATLDSLYTHVFATISAKKLDMVFKILGLLILPCRESDSEGGSLFKGVGISEFLALEIGKLDFYLADLSSVVQWNHNSNEVDDISISHASLSDFLLDPRRSKEFYLHPPTFYASAAQACMDNLRGDIQISGGTTGKSLFRKVDSSFFRLAYCWENATLTPDLRRDILSFSLWPSYHLFLMHCRNDVVWKPEMLLLQWPATNLVRLSLNFLRLLQTIAPAEEKLISERKSEFDQWLLSFLLRYGSDMLEPTGLGIEQVYPYHNTLVRVLGKANSFSSDTMFRSIFIMDKPYSDHLLKFFQDARRSGGYSLTGIKYAKAALACFQAVCSTQDYYRLLLPSREVRLLPIQGVNILHAIPHLLERSTSQSELLSFIRSGRFASQFGDGHYFTYMDKILASTSSDVRVEPLVRKILHASDEYLKRADNEPMVRVVPPFIESEGWWEMLSKWRTRSS